MEPIGIARVEAFCFRAPIRQPILTSFGSIPARTVLLVRVEDRDGAHGWGEVWANFPPVGAEHKLRLLQSIVIPTALGRSYDSLPAAWLDLTARCAATGCRDVRVLRGRSCGSDGQGRSRD